MYGTIVVAVLSLVISLCCAYFTVEAGKTCERAERKADELQSMVESRFIGIDDDLKRVRKGLVENERSHGVLAMEIKEISSLRKTDELRKEVLRTRGKGGE